MYLGLGDIESFMDEKIRPVLAVDGGGLEVLKVEGDNIFVKFLGTCVGCAWQRGTLKAINREFKKHYDFNVKVIL